MVPSPQPPRNSDSPDAGTAAPVFDAAFRAQLDALLRWRRDVRRFRPEPVPADLVDRLLGQTVLAPSVGLSQPTRFVMVATEGARAAAARNFADANAEALAGLSGRKARDYAGLKLSGMDRAPVQIAVCVDEETARGSGLGAGTMPEMRAYSAVCAVMQLWLSARAEGLGLGWVSILEPERLLRDLCLPEDWRLVAYLCLGWPDEEHEDPELARAGWESRLPLPSVLHR